MTNPTHPFPQAANGARHPSQHREPGAGLHPVHLVGAGPGDPDLLTLRAARVLGAADVVLCDDLVDARVLGLARKDARVLKVGKRGGCVSTGQQFIHRVMIREARRGLRVVRLKGGDPFMFGRGGEECDALRNAGIAVEVVPGITAGMAAPTSLGIPVTDRRHAPGVAFVTGHNQPGGEGPDWAALARSGLTLVIYMGVARCGQLVGELVAAGLRPDTPAAAISAACTPRQRQVVCTLATLAAASVQERIASPAILVIGEVVSCANTSVVEAVGLGEVAFRHAAQR